jgi:hypothetical protein
MESICCQNAVSFCSETESQFLLQVYVLKNTVYLTLIAYHLISLENIKMTHKMFVFEDKLNAHSVNSIYVYYKLTTFLTFRSRYVCKYFIRYTINFSVVSINQHTLVFKFKNVCVLWNPPFYVIQLKIYSLVVLISVITRFQIFLTVQLSCSPERH